MDIWCRTPITIIMWRDIDGVNHFHFQDICKSANQSGSKQSHKFRPWSMGDALWEVVFLETSQFVVAWRQPVDFDSRIGFVNPTLCQEWAALAKTNRISPAISCSYTHTMLCSCAFINHKIWIRNTNWRPWTSFFVCCCCSCEAASWRFGVRLVERCSCARCSSSDPIRIACIFLNLFSQFEFCEHYYLHAEC